MFTRHTGAFLVHYKATEIVDGGPNRAQRSDRLCAKGGKYHARACKAVKLTRDEFMLMIRRNQHSSHRLQQDISAYRILETASPALLRRDRKRLIKEQLPELK